MNSYQMLVNILDEKLGVVFLDDEQDDFIISDYVVDSIAFIQFIILIKNSIFRNSLIFQGLPPIKYQNLMYFPLFLPL